MASNKSVKCKICGKKYVSKQALIDHIEKAHSANIPEGWNAARYENYLRTGKTEGKCVYCGKETGWNDTTGKYNRMCGSEACKKKARELANKNYIGKHGKPYTINDPEQQKKMVYGRKNSGKYIFEDEDTGKKYVAMYDSSYGRDFLEMLDTFLNWDGADIIAPSPHTYYYEYEGKKHFYIPDVYSTSLNLEIELKDGGDNPNMHPKIQAVDKIKEKKKDEVMESLKGQVNYIKICNKDYTEFFALLSSLKEKDTCQLPKWEGKLESINGSTVETNIVAEATLNRYRLFVKRQKLLKDPMLNYDDLMEYYRKRLFHDNLSKSEWDALYNELNQVRDYLKAVINDTHNENNKRMNYEAKKALQQVEGFIIYMEDQNQVPVKESVGSNKVPFYIVSWDYDSMVGGGVKLITKSQYNHTSIALTPNLEECYTFSRNPETVKSHRTNGFCKESLSYMVSRYGDANIKVDAVYVPKSDYNKLRNNIEEYIKKQENTSFDYINFAYSAFKIPREELDEDKLNCSVFVDLLLKKSGIDLTNGKNSNLVTPGDLSELDSKHKNITTVYIGKASEYNLTNVSESTFIEATKDEERYYPVFIFLSYTGTNMAKMIKSFTHDPYSHSSLSFDTELTNMVSFNREGMVTENIKDGLWKERAATIKYSLYMYLATAEEYDAMRNFVNELLSKRANLKYNILGLTNFVFGRGSDREDKFFCSEFVAATINAGDKKVIKTKPYMTSPYMLAKNKNFKFIKKGLVKNYNAKVVDNIIQDYLEGGGYENVTIK